MKRLFFLFSFLVFLTSCTAGASESPETNEASKKSVTLSLVNWNVQTFFDAELDGTEYSDFQSAGKWSRDKYLVRLKRLCDVMRELNADIYVFEEIENEAILYDISNQLVGNDWSSKNKWHFACFAKDENASIGCAVVSRFQLSGVKTHCIDVRTMNENQPEMRPLLEVTATVGDYSLQIFAVHWKSKLGDNDSTEIWRDWQEGLLGSKLLNSEADAIVMCGDFNRDAKEFVLDFSGGNRIPNTIIRAVGGDVSKSCELKVYSPWFNENGDFCTEIGSYYYDNAWERIDQIFTFGNVKLASFSPRAEVPWANEQGIPIGYKIYTGEGYSDHLPIMCSLVLGNKE